MAEFEYIARRAAGDLVTGTIEAANEREVLQKLADGALFTVQIKAARAATAATVWRRRVRARHVAQLYSQLSDLLRSGVPLLRSMEILQRQSVNPAIAQVLEQVRTDVAEGTTLADAMARHPRVFSELAVSMIRAGQEGGFLEDVLRRIAEFTEHQEDLKARVVGALAYPLFLLAVTGVVLGVMLTFFVPKFERIFERMRERGQLPTLTEALLTTSAVIQANWVLLLLGVAALAGMAYAALRSEEGRLWWDRAKLRVPGFKHVWRGWAIARFSRILGTMLANGINILTALKIAKDSTGNRVLAAAIDRASDSVSGGDTVAAPLRACGQFPADIIEMIAIGEESNNLEQVLINIADTTERRLARHMELLVRLLEPVMLLVMAGVTLLVVAALLLPVFKMSTAL
jgi:general secretion pathway protein F/type IV pilus assembly protein PilC